MQYFQTSRQAIFVQRFYSQNDDYFCFFKTTKIPQKIRNILLIFTADEFKKLKFFVEINNLAPIYYFFFVNYAETP